MNEAALKKLQKKLVLSYLSASCILLFIVLFTVGLLLYQNLVRNSRHTIQYDLTRYIDKIEKKRWVDHYFFNMEELENGYVIFILDQGEPTLFQGSLLSRKERALLLEELENHEITYSQCTTLNFLSRTFFVYQYKSGNGMIQCYICKDIKTINSAFSLQLLILFFGFIIGCILLYFLISKMAFSAMKPIRENMQKQEEFLHAASHELKSPLAVIRTNNSASLVDGENHDKYREIIENECQRMASLIQDLLLIVSGGSLGHTVTKKPKRPDTILIQCYEMMQPLVKKAGMPLAIDLGKQECGEILVDADRIEQVLQTLVCNAIEYGASEKGILLKLQKNKKQISFIVRDFGPGIPAVDAENVFERFYRGSKSRTDKSHFGLGLSVARQLTNDMGGKIILDKTNKSGAAFIVTFREL